MDAELTSGARRRVAGDRATVEATIEANGR